MNDLLIEFQTLWATARPVFRGDAPAIWTCVFGYLVIINCGVYLVFRNDKARSITGDWRWSEAGLLQASFLGGSIGAKIAQRRFRHKTRKEPFRSTLNFICVVQVIGGVAGLVWYFG